MTERLSGFLIEVVLRRHDHLHGNMLRRLMIIDLVLANIPVIHKTGDICRANPIPMD